MMPKRKSPGRQAGRPEGVSKRNLESSRKIARLQRRRERVLRLSLSEEKRSRSPGEQELRRSARKRAYSEPDERGSHTEDVEQTSSKRRRLEYSNGCQATEHESEQPKTITTPEEEGAQGQIDPIAYWAQSGHWPQDYFISNEQTRKDLERDSWLEPMERQDRHSSDMSYNIQRKSSDSSLGRKKSDPNLTPPTDQTQREFKGVQYRDIRYPSLLATKGIFMKESDLGITEASTDLWKELLYSDQPVPQGTLFEDSIFKKTCRNIQDRNEARVIQDITRLLVPSAETLATFGSTNLDKLTECVNEGWTLSIPLHGPRPQPDYSAGFERFAFTEDQIQKLDVIAGIERTSYYGSTYLMHFPFLMCEVKCGAAALDIADRQNAHSAAIAVRAVVELFRLVGKEKDLDREILAFSISHDSQDVRIYGHYAIIHGVKTSYYRHLIHSFSFVALDGKEKWTAYKFTKNVYDIWMPKHFERICSAIDKLPEGIDFDVAQEPELSFSDPPDVQGAVYSQPSLSSAQSSLVGSADVTPTTSFTKGTTGTAEEHLFKKPKVTQKEPDG